MDANLSQILLITGLTIFVYMNLVYLLAMKVKNASIVDVAWGLGFVAVALVLLISTGSFNPAAVTLYCLVNLWGLRLTNHLAIRNLGQAEDWRYRAWRKQWGSSYAWRSYLQIFMLQGLMMWLISLSLVIAFAAGAAYVPEGSWLAAGVAVWIIGFGFEAVADWQLAKFKKAGTKKAGSVLSTGLWRFSRHPNYFGEILQWWGLWLCVLNLPMGWVAVISPLTITWLIVFVSGVPLLERKYAKDKAYQAYAKRTSRLVPWPPKP